MPNEDMCLYVLQLIWLQLIKGIERVVELLIRHGSDLSARDNSQKTALHLAAESGQDTIVHSLIIHGSDI